MTMDVLTAARNVGADFNGGVVALAPLIGKNHNSLSAELRKEGSAKFGLADAVKMTLETRDYRILDAFNMACGRMSIPLPELAGLESDDCVVALAKASREFSQLCSEVLESLGDDGVISDNERARIQREGGEALTTINALMAAVAARNAAGKPVQLRAAA